MIVVDASIAFKWIQYKNEEFRPQAQTLYKNHQLKKDIIVVPSLFFIEIANALATKSATSEVEMEKAIKFMFKSGLKVEEPTQEDILRSSNLAKKYKTSVYDMLYAVIAKRNKVNLITADKRFIERTGFKFAKHISEV
jgi:predicted nucleic acid-binding protein